MRYILLILLFAIVVGCKKENRLSHFAGTYNCLQTCYNTWYYDPSPNVVDTSVYENRVIVVKLIDGEENKLDIDGNYMQRNSNGTFSSTNSPYQQTVAFIGDSIFIEGNRDYRPDSYSSLSCITKGRKQ